MGKSIEEVLARRTDLSTFLVHLTRRTPGRRSKSADEVLTTVIQQQKLVAKKPYGAAVDLVESWDLGSDDEKEMLDSQRCVCFTETPLEHADLLTGKIDDRQVQLEPFGVAITKRQGRLSGINPVWYIDITQPSSGYRRWLTNDVNELLNEAANEDEPWEHPIAKLAPFIEQMGSGARKEDGKGYRKEFWWEREWRHVGDFELPAKLIVICPEDLHHDFKKLDRELADEDRTYRLRPKLIDISWSLEEMIASLAGFTRDEARPV